MTERWNYVKLMFLDIKGGEQKRLELRLLNMLLKILLFILQICHGYERVNLMSRKKNRLGMSFLIKHALSMFIKGN